MVSSIRVDKHASSIVPSIKARKAVFVEWPIEANLTKAKELTELVKQHNVRNIVGLQGRYAPVVRTLRELVDAGEIG